MSAPRIVVIDPPPAVREAATTLVEVQAYGVVVHPRAADAVTVMEQVQPTVALIGFPLDRPRAGLDLVRALRADGATRAVPLIVWSTDPTVWCHVAALRLPGVRPYLDMATRPTSQRRLPGSSLAEPADPVRGRAAHDRTILRARIDQVGTGPVWASARWAAGPALRLARGVPSSWAPPANPPVPSVTSLQ